MPLRVCSREVGLWLRISKLSMSDRLTSSGSLMGMVRKKQEYGNFLQRKQEMEICANFMGGGIDEETKERKSCWKA